MIEVKPKKLVLMRHGVSCANQASGSPDIRRWTSVQPLLTMRGIDQVIRSVEKLQISGINGSYYIICSMLPRSIFTASIVSYFLGSESVHVYPYIGETTKWYEDFFSKGKSSQNVTTLHESLIYTEVIKYILKKIGITPPEIDFSEVNREIMKQNKVFPSSSTPSLEEQPSSSSGGPSSSEFEELVKVTSDLTGLFENINLDGFVTDETKVYQVIDDIKQEEVLMVSHGDLLDKITRSNFWNNLKNKKRSLKKNESKEDIKYDANCSFLLTEYSLGHLKIIGDLIVTPYMSDVMYDSIKKFYESGEHYDDSEWEDVSYSSTVRQTVAQASGVVNGFHLFFPEFINSENVRRGLSNPMLPITLLEAFLTCRHHLHGMILVPYFIKEVENTLKQKKYFENYICKKIIKKLNVLSTEYFENWNFSIVSNIHEVKMSSFNTLEGLEAIRWNDKTVPYF